MEKWKEEYTISLYDAFTLYNRQLYHGDDLYTKAIRSMIMHLFILTEDEFILLSNDLNNNSTKIMNYLHNQNIN